MKHIIKQRIVPNRCIITSERYEIINIKPEYIVKEYVLEVDENNMLQSLFLKKSKHPNCDPNTNRFCNPTEFNKISYPLDKYSSFYIQCMLEVFNLDACYFRPWNDFVYEKGHFKVFVDLEN